MFEPPVSIPPVKLTCFLSWFMGRRIITVIIIVIIIIMITVSIIIDIWTLWRHVRIVLLLLMHGYGGGCGRCTLRMSPARPTHRTLNDITNVRIDLWRYETTTGAIVTGRRRTGSSGSRRGTTSPSSRRRRLRRLVMVPSSTILFDIRVDRNARRLLLLSLSVIIDTGHRDGCVMLLLFGRTANLEDNFHVIRWTTSTNASM